MFVPDGFTINNKIYAQMFYFNFISGRFPQTIKNNGVPLVNALFMRKHNKLQIGHFISYLVKIMTSWKYMG